jgi:hypothetical protein
LIFGAKDKGGDLGLWKVLPPPILLLLKNGNGQKKNAE